MANPSTFGADDALAVLETTNGGSASTTIENPQFGLEVRHNGLGTGGSDDVFPVIIGVNAAPAGSAAGGTGKFILRYGDPPLFIKPGCKTLYTYGLGGAPTLSINYVLLLGDRG